MQEMQNYNNIVRWEKWSTYAIVLYVIMAVVLFLGIVVYNWLVITYPVTHLRENRLVMLGLTIFLNLLSLLGLAYILIGLIGEKLCSSGIFHWVFKKLTLITDPFKELEVALGEASMSPPDDPLDLDLVRSIKYVAFKYTNKLPRHEIAKGISSLVFNGHYFLLPEMIITAFQKKIVYQNGEIDKKLILQFTKKASKYLSFASQDDIECLGQAYDYAMEVKDLVYVWYLLGEIVLEWQKHNVSHKLFSIIIEKHAVEKEELVNIDS